VPDVSYLTVLRAKPSAHVTTHGSFTRAMPSMGHNNFRRVVPAQGTTHMVHRRRRREGRKGGRRQTEGEGVAGVVSRSPEQGRRAQGELRSAAAD
jgi:hypothetical protein